MTTYDLNNTRQAKDSAVIMTPDNRILFPDIPLISDLMGIPDSFKSNLTSSEIATEIIGQGVDHPLYKKIIMSIKKHIESFIFAQKSHSTMAAYHLLEPTALLNDASDAVPHKKHHVIATCPLVNKTTPIFFCDILNISYHQSSVEIRLTK